MSLAERPKAAAPRRRLYVVHLLYAVDQTEEEPRYIARIRPWATRTHRVVESRERAFADECDLIATINPLLPSGSDVRDVFEHVESASGFFYLLRLSDAEAHLLGWS